MICSFKFNRCHNSDVNMFARAIFWLPHCGANKCVKRNKIKNHTYKVLLMFCILFIFDHSQLKSSFGPFSDFTLSLRIHI